jgi:hypothetical protein
MAIKKRVHSHRDSDHIVNGELIEKAPIIKHRREMTKRSEQLPVSDGDGFTIQESDGPKTYQYLGPQDAPGYGPGRNFFLKPPASSPEMM